MYIETIDRNAATLHYPGDTQINQRLVESRRAFQGYFRRRLGNPQDAEDAFQDFSLKVIRSAQSLRDGEKIGAWLGRTMHNTLIDHYRRSATRRKAEAAFAQEVQVTTAETRDSPTEVPCKCLYAALSRLKPDHAVLLRRADLAEEPRDRIAADLGLTINTLRVRLHRARQALKAELEGLCPACSAGSFLDCDCA